MECHQGFSFHNWNFQVLLAWCSIIHNVLFELGVCIPSRILNCYLDVPDLLVMKHGITITTQKPKHKVNSGLATVHLVPKILRPRTGNFMATIFWDHMGILLMITCNLVKPLRTSTSLMSLTIYKLLSLEKMCKMSQKAWCSKMTIPLCIHLDLQLMQWSIMGLKLCLICPTNQTSDYSLLQNLKEALLRLPVWWWPQSAAEGELNEQFHSFYQNRHVS